MADRRDTVVLLHGIVKSPIDLLAASLYFKHHGYATYRPGYSVREAGISAIADRIWANITQRGLDTPDAKIHFIGHSMGGLVIDDMLRRHQPQNLGRVVMWGTPLQGSDYADRLDASGIWGPIYRMVFREPGQGLRVAPGMPHRDQPIGYEAGVIAGTCSMNPTARLFIGAHGAHDGIVPLKRTFREGLRDHLALPVTHSGMLFSPGVMRQTAHFLKQGQFFRPS